jgi:hypothetical protein
MADAMSQHTRAIVTANIHAARVDKTEYNPTVEMTIPDWLKGA